MLPPRLKVALHILQQGSKGRPVMVVRDLPARPAPEPRDPIGVWIVGRRVHNPQVVLPLRQPLAHQLRARGRMGAQVVHDPECDAPSGGRPGDRGPHLGAKDIRGAVWSQAAVQPALAPVTEPEAIDCVVGPWGFDQTLPAAAFATPDAREGGMQRQMDCILERNIGMWPEVQESCKVWRHVLKQSGLDTRGHGGRGGACRPQPISPPPAGVSHGAWLLRRFAFARPCWALAHVASGMEIQTHGLVCDGNLGLAGQIHGQQAGGPMGTADPDRRRGEGDHPQQCGFPRGRHGRRHAGRFVGRNGRETALEKAREHALDGIAAAEHNGRNLGHGAPLMGEQDPLLAQAEMGLGRCIVPLVECGDLGVGQRR